MARKTRKKPSQKKAPAGTVNLEQGRVTLQDIADVVGVSSMTVSLSLRNHSRISEQTRKRVQKVAKDLDYRPDPALKALSHYRHGRKDRPIHAAIGWINSWEDPKKLRTYRLFDHYWKGASAAAEMFGYHLEELVVGKDMSMERLAKILHARNVRGVLIPPSPVNHEMWNRFAWDDFSVVRLSRKLDAEDIPANTVMTNQFSNASLAFKKTRELGYKRIGFVGISWHTRHFGGGILWSQAFIPEQERLPLLLLDTNRPEAYAGRLKDWIDTHKPDAIITEFNELPTLLQGMNIRIPEDIGIATTEVMDSQIQAGITQNPEEVGRVSTTVLTSLIHENARGFPAIHREILVDGSWVDGVSMPPKNR